MAIDIHRMLTTPELGQPISPQGQMAYRKRASSEHQSVGWNERLEQDPIYRNCGFRVGVAPLPSDQGDGLRWELIWVIHND